MTKKKKSAPEIKRHQSWFSKTRDSIVGKAVNGCHTSKRSRKSASSDRRSNSSTGLARTPDGTRNSFNHADATHKFSSSISVPSLQPLSPIYDEALDVDLNTPRKPVLQARNQPREWLTREPSIPDNTISRRDHVTSTPSGIPIWSSSSSSSGKPRYSTSKSTNWLSPCPARVHGQLVTSDAGSSSVSFKDLFAHLRRRHRTPEQDLIPAQRPGVAAAVRQLSIRSNVSRGFHARQSMQLTLSRASEPNLRTRQQHPMLKTLPVIDQRHAKATVSLPELLTSGNHHRLTKPESHTAYSSARRQSGTHQNTPRVTQETGSEQARLLEDELQSAAAALRHLDTTQDLLPTHDRDNQIPSYAKSTAASTRRASHQYNA